MKHETIARIAHEMNRVWCELNGDFSQQQWAFAPDWQRDSAIKGVKFHAENPDAGPEHSHECWLSEKLADGWKYGPKKNSETKEHPCMVPYEQLPKVQQAKDTIFLTVVKALL